MVTFDDHAEWLEADGRGGFASGTATGIHTRRYHALLLAAVTPPTGRMVLVNGVDAWIETHGGTFALSSQRYHPGIIHLTASASVVERSGRGRGRTRTRGPLRGRPVAARWQLSPPRGRPFQAWSAGELLRLDRQVLSQTLTTGLEIS